MFNDKEKSKTNIESLIGENCSIEGTINGSGLLIIDGIVEGDIIWDDEVIIGTIAHCRGNISCINAIINGKVDGNVFCQDTLTVHESGKIIGDIKFKKIVVTQGGIIQGNCNMIAEEKVQEEILPE